MKLKSDILSSSIYTASEWVIRFSLANIIWLLLNIPLIFVLINLFYVEKIQDTILWIIILFIMIPFTFFPATQAVFSLARDWIIKKETHNFFIFKDYWHHFKKNYFKSLAGGTVLSIIWLIWAADFLYSSKHNLILMTIFIITGSILYVFSINFFSINSHYEMNFRSILRKTLFFTISSPMLFIIILFTNGFIVFISLFIFNFLTVFLMTSLIAYISFYAFYKRYLYLLKNV